MKVVKTLWHRYLKRPYRLRFTEVGQGAPIVLLHGLASSGAAWEPLVKQLDTTKWRVITPDLLGFGGSPRPDWSAYDVQEHARTVAHTLRKIKLDQPAVVVGHSMGCLVATQFATMYPKLVRRLVLYQPPLFGDDPEYRKHAKRRDQYFAMYEYIAKHPQLLLAESRIVKAVLARIHGFTISQDYWIPFERSLRNTIMQQQALEQLRHITIPTDVIHGRLDFVVTRADVRHMFAENRHISMHLVNRMHSVSPRAAKFLADLVI